MVATAESVEWIQVRNDVEALMLEYSLIKQHQPRFNIRLRDDKSYPFLAVTLDDEWPRATVMRGTKRKGTRYFGPYGHAWAIRDTLDLLLAHLPDPHVLRQQARPPRAAGAAVPAVPHREVQRARAWARSPRRTTTGWSPSWSTSSTATPTPSCSASRPRCRRRATSSSSSGRPVSATVSAPSARPSRSSRWWSRSPRTSTSSASTATTSRPRCRCSSCAAGGWSAARASCSTRPRTSAEGELVDRVLEGLYADPPPLGVPKQVLVPVDSRRPRALRGVAHATCGARRSPIRVPQRGDKRELLETVTRNATEEFNRHRLRRAADHNTRARALNDLQEHLGLPEAPLRIECYDMSHIQGSDYVGSMVVLEDGLPSKSEYRRFKIKGDAGQRRLRGHGGGPHPAPVRLPRRPREAGGRAGGKFSYPPQLLLVDGGKGQLDVAVRVLEELGLEEEIPVASLAKRFEEVYVPGESEPRSVPRQSEALYLLQRIRDEAHRFAISYHRQLRGKRMTTSVLDGVPGLGADAQEAPGQGARRGRRVKKADLDELTALCWLPDPVAQAVYDKIHAIRAEMSAEAAPRGRTCRRRRCPAPRPATFSR